MVGPQGICSPEFTRLGDRLDAELSKPSWTSLRAAVAFAKMSGVRRIYDQLDHFGKVNPGGLALTVGIDHGGTTVEALSALKHLTDLHRGDLWIAHNPQSSPRPTFHPKMWLFSSGGGDNLLLVGSGNLTQGGLYTNYEAAIAIAATDSDQVIIDATAFLNEMSNVSRPDVARLTNSLLQHLHDRGDVPSEPQTRRTNASINSMHGAMSGHKPSQPIFLGKPITVNMPLPSSNIPNPVITVRPPASSAPPALPSTGAGSAGGQRTRGARSTTVTPQHRFFYITVEMRQKTEVFLAKAPLAEDPAFFGAPFRGLTTPKRANNTPQPQADPEPIVRIELHLSAPIIVNNHPLKLWTYTYGTSANDDFRTNFTSNINRNMPSGSVVRFERDPTQYGNLQFAIDIYPPGHTLHGQMLAHCTQKLRNSTRMYGWA